MTVMSAEESIKSVLTGLLSGIDAQNEKAYLEVSELDAFKLARAKVEEGNPEEFYFVLSYPLGEAVDGLISSVLPNNDRAHFIFKHYDFVESHIEKVIERFEGSPCSADKTSAVISRLLRFYIKGDEITFDPSAEYTFHHPKQILTNHEEIVDFFEAIHRLYYGDGDRYLKAFAKLNIANK
jgi:hypothetical protein